MSKQKAPNFSDTPIESPREDLFNFDPFAQSIANCIQKLRDPVDGCVIAIYGPWGSGKSSAINLIRHHLAQSDDSPTIIEFLAWQHQDERAITAGFFSALSSGITPVISPDGKFAKTLAKSSEAFLGTLTALNIAAVLSSLPLWIRLSIKWAKKGAEDSANKKNTPEYLKKDLARMLRESRKRFLVVIDEMDRLSPQEALLVFRLVKSIGKLPNVVYLLAYDREILEEAVSDEFPSEGPQYLEKIVQAGFDLPLVNHRQQRAMINSMLIEFQVPNTGDVEQMFRELVAHEFLQTPRDILRLFNSLSVSMAGVANDVYFMDFVCLEVLRLFHPDIYRTIRDNRNAFLNAGRQPPVVQDNTFVSFLDRFLDSMPKDEQKRMQWILSLLFPQLQTSLSPSSPISMGTWEKDRRICSPNHFDTYFTSSVSPFTVPKDEIDFLIAPSITEIDIRKKFDEAFDIVQAGGLPKVLCLLEELMRRSDEIEDEPAKRILSGIYSMADRILFEIDDDPNKHMLNHFTLLQFTQTILLRRFRPEDRSDALLHACENATIGWLVGISTAIWRERHPAPEERVYEHEVLTTEKDAQILKDRVLHRIKSDASKGLILDAWAPLDILLKWNELQEPNSEQVQHYLLSELENDVSVVKLARAFLPLLIMIDIKRPTGHDFYADIYRGLRLLDDVLNRDQLVNRIREVAASHKISVEQQETVRQFLSQWDMLVERPSRGK